MLNRLSGQELINKSLVQNGEVEKTALQKNNPYSNADRKFYASN